MAPVSFDGELPTPAEVEPDPQGQALLRRT